MRSEGRHSTAHAMATALKVWAEARERAISDLNRTAASLDALGQSRETTRLRAAASHLHTLMLGEGRLATAIAPRYEPLTTKAHLEVA
jgi:hypothetical protein